MMVIKSILSLMCTNPNICYLEGVRVCMWVVDDVDDEDDHHHHQDQQREKECIYLYHYNRAIDVFLEAKGEEMNKL